MAFPVSIVDFAIAARMPEPITASTARSMWTPPLSRKPVVPLLIISRQESCALM